MSTISGGFKKCQSRATSFQKSETPDILGGVVAGKTLFYKRAADKTTNPIGKRMFLSIIEEEKKQIDAFRRIPEIRAIKPRHVACSMKKIKTFFKKTGDTLLEKIGNATDQVEALKIAMEMKQESIELCERLSQTMQAPQEKALLENLVKEERQRNALFLNTCFFLSDAGNWYMWDEYSTADGGTPWA